MFPSKVNPSTLNPGLFFSPPSPTHTPPLTLRRYYKTEYIQLHLITDDELFFSFFFFLRASMIIDPFYDMLQARKKKVTQAALN